MMFFSKEKDLVDKLLEHKRNFKKYQEDMDKELHIKDVILQRHLYHIKVLQKELCLAKEILGDQKLCKTATRNYRQTIMGVENKNKFLIDNSTLTEQVDSF